MIWDQREEYWEESLVFLLLSLFVERLPEVTPIDSGFLRSAYTFRLEGDQLIVGNDVFYNLAIRRFGGDHDLVSVIECEALTIVNGADFRRTVRDRALART